MIFYPAAVTRMIVSALVPLSAGLHRSTAVHVASVFVNDGYPADIKKLLKNIP